MTKEIEFSLKD